ncbi:MAG: aminoacyl-tRNA hydrolase [Planctomycetota bacterium]
MSPRVLFGLGNPGKRYRETRHNAGWQVLDAIAEAGGGAFKRTRLLHGETADVRVGDIPLRLVKPHSFMNLCGPVYRRALEVFDVGPEDALVVVDDFALPFGRLRLRKEGSAGGHNGLKSIQDALGDTAYPRLRLGIGPVPEAMEAADYVLRRYDAAQRRALPDLVQRGVAACETWARDGLDEAMNRFNVSSDPP